MLETTMITLGLSMDASYSEAFLESVSAFNVACHGYIESCTEDLPRVTICCFCRAGVKPSHVNAQRFTRKLFEELIKTFIRYDGCSKEETDKFFKSLSVEYCEWCYVEKSHKISLANS